MFKKLNFYIFFIFLVSFLMGVNAYAGQENLDPDHDGILSQYEDLNRDGDLENDDTDLDGKPNYLDPDDDNDSIPTAYEGEKEDVYENKIYIITADSLRMLNAASYELIRGIRWQETPSGVAISEKNNKVYTLHPRSRKLFKMNTISKEFEYVPGLKNSASNIILSPNQELAYISNSAIDTIQVLDLAKNKTLRTFKTGSKPTYMTMTKNGKHLFVLNELDETISKIDTTTGKKESVISVGGSPAGIALSGDGTKVFVTDMTHGRVVMFNTRNNLKIGEIKVGKAPSKLTLNPDEQMLFVSNRYSGTVSVVDIPKKKQIAEVKVGEGPSGMALSSDGKTLYVLNEFSGDMSIIDVPTQTTTQHIPIGTRPVSIVLE